MNVIAWGECAGDEDLANDKQVILYYLQRREDRQDDLAATLWLYESTYILTVGEKEGTVLEEIQL